MIKRLLTITFVLISTLAFSQMNGDVGTTFGVRAYNYVGMPKMLHQTDKQNYLGSAFSSYLIKFNDNLFSYRLNGSYFDKSFSFANNCADCAVANGKVKDYTFKAGFEKNFIYGPVQPYIAFDLGYRSNGFDRSISNLTAQDLLVASRKRGFTVTPSLGLKVNPIPEISIFAEGNIEYFYAWGKETSASLEDNSMRSATKFKDGEYLLNPISVGVQFHLGKKK
jgi:hypothetical protein